MKELFIAYVGAYRESSDSTVSISMVPSFERFLSKKNLLPDENQINQPILTA